MTAETRLALNQSELEYGEDPMIIAMYAGFEVISEREFIELTSMFVDRF